LYGVCTWIFGDADLRRLAPALAEAGFAGVELLADVDRYKAASTRRVLAESGLDIFSLTPVEADLAHPDGTVRKSAIDAYRRMIDFAAELGAPMVACHGAVGRIHPFSTREQELHLLEDSVQRVVDHAASCEVRVAFEILNRYETNLVRTVAEANALFAEVEADSLGLLLDTYHMNIEESDLPSAVAAAGDRLFLLHVADSNRQAPGRGHVPFLDILGAARQGGYVGPLVVESCPAGADPFAVDPDPGTFSRALAEAAAAVAYLRELERADGG
jgi:sugar phosphate isomerase/epimerase